MAWVIRHSRFSRSSSGCHSGRKVSWSQNSDACDICEAVTVVILVTDVMLVTDVILVTVVTAVIFVPDMTLFC